MSLAQLWFDALWNCFSVNNSSSVHVTSLWFDALWNCFSVFLTSVFIPRRCDLMLFEIVFQSRRFGAWSRRVVIWCSLKLFFSLNWLDRANAVVVIWCSLKLFFSETAETRNTVQVVIWCSLKLFFSTKGTGTVQEALWFDALWNCFSVSMQHRHHEQSCDLMLFEIVFQYPVYGRGDLACCDLMLFEIVFQYNLLWVD